MEISCSQQCMSAAALPLRLEVEGCGAEFMLLPGFYFIKNESASG